MKVRVDTIRENMNAHEVIIWRERGSRLSTRVKSVKHVYSSRAGENLVDEILLFGIAGRYRGF